MSAAAAAAAAAAASNAQITHAPKLCEHVRVSSLVPVSKRRPEQELVCRETTAEQHVVFIIEEVSAVVGVLLRWW
jgi:hypothetical protein